jgi:hypothetical protein
LSRTVATTGTASASLHYERQPRDVPPGAFHLVSISRLRVRLRQRLPRTPGSTRPEVVTLFARRGFEKDHGFNVRWLRAARRVLKADGTLWVTGTHHIIFSLGFALQRLGFRINNILWSKPNATLDALHTPSSTKRRWHSAPQEPPRVRYPYRVAFHAHQRLLQVAGAYTWDAP